MSIIDKATSAVPLELMDTEPAFFVTDQKVPAHVSLPGSSNFDLTLFNVTAVGSVKAATPGSLTLTLYGSPKADIGEASASPEAWLPLASSMAEPIGGESDLAETMWMIQGTNLMIFTGSGKLQGTFQSNVASNPQGPLDIEQHPGDIEDSDPLYVFAVGASFIPEGGQAGGDSQTIKDKMKAKATAEATCTLTLANFTISGE